VAIKLWKKQKLDPEFHLRFQREKDILSALHSETNNDQDKIAWLHDAASLADGRPYLVMEYVEGKSFLEYCDDRRLSVRQRLEIFLKVCEAVLLAHSHGVVHCDLKP